MLNGADSAFPCGLQMMSHDTLIVGGGIGGAVLANLLACGGKRVFPRDFVRVQLKFGNCPTFVHPGAALIGDAAHPVTPAGGQGANLAIADARCLADAILRGTDPLLTDYDRIRRRAANRSLRLSRGAAWAFSLPENVLAYAPLAPLVRLVNRWPSLLRIGLKTPATAFV